MPKILLILIMLGIGIGCEVGAPLGPTVGIDAPSDAPAVPRKRLAIIGGQSNATGTGVAADVTNYEGLTLAYPAVTINRSNAPNTASDPPAFVLEGPGSLAPRTEAIGATFPIGTAGIELVLGRELTERTIDEWRIGQYTISGSSITFWVDPNYPTVAPSLQNRFIAFIQAEMTAHEVTDSADVVICWLQGESDVGGSYADHLTRMNTLFDAIRAAIGADVVFVTNRFNSTIDTTTAIRGAIEVFSLDNEPAYVVHSDEIPYRPGEAHYTDDGYQTLALKFADIIVDHYEENTPTTPRYLGTGQVIERDSATSPTAVLPPHKVGDRIVVFLVGIGNVNYEAPTGYTEITGSPQHDNGSALNARLQAWSRLVLISDTLPLAAPQVLDIGGDDYKLLGATVFEDAGTLESGSGAVGASTTTPTLPGGTTAGANALVVGLIGYTTDFAVPQLTNFANADLTEVTEHVNHSTSTSIGYGVAMVTARKAIAGPFDEFTATLANASEFASLTFVLNR